MSQASAANTDSPAEPPLTPAEPPLTDWTLRPFAGTRCPPLLVGSGYALGMIAFSWVFRLATGQWETGFVRTPFFWLDILNGVVFAYVPTATWLLRRGRLRDLRALRPVLRCDDAGWEQLAQRTVSVSPRRLLASALVGVAILAALPVVLQVARMSATGLLIGHTLVTELAGIAAFAEIGARRIEIDLFDLRRLAPFARTGLRSAFAWVLASSLVSLFWLGPGAGHANTVIVFGILALVSGGFYFTIRGVHQSICEAKREALDGLTQGIRRAGAVLQRGASRGDAPALADLVAYHGFLERVPEWPLSAPSLVRGALIAALGVGSWLGGALVERLIDSVF
ncbi:MAG: hypothetical protein JRH16_23010 [Deltaproteobacteria bacterium]|nr:hypothetical protein [Deltaproteobacteria bacterium]